jgi:hypothetical protein
MGAVRPIHAVKSPSVSTADPILDGGQADVEVACDGTLRLAAPDGGDDLATTLNLSLILAMVASGSGPRFQSILLPRLTGIIWHRSDRDHVAPVR